MNEIEERFFNYFGTYSIHRKRVRELRFYGTPISQLLPQQVPEIIRAALNWGTGKFRTISKSESSDRDI